MKALILLLPAFCTTPLAAQTDTLCQQPGAATSQDASLGYHDFFNTSVNNYGSDIYLKAFCIPGSAGGQNTNRGLLYFDLSTIPAGSQVLSAQLDLYATGFINTLLPGHFGNNLAYIEQVTAPWNEFTVTWNNQPASTALNRGVLQPSTSSTQDYSVNLNALIQGLVNNPAINFGLLLRLDTESPNSPAALAFHSSDGPIPSKHPALCVIWKGGELSSETHQTTIYASSESPQYVLVYPNPASCGGEINIETREFGTEVNYMIADAGGRIISQKQTTITNGLLTVSVNNLACGNYLLYIESENKKYYSRFIIQ